MLEKVDGRALAASWQQRWNNSRPFPKAAETESTPYICYAARPNSLIVRADGSLGKCTVMLKDPRNRVGTLRPDGKLEMRPGALAPWIRGFKSLDNLELGCPATKLPKQDDGLHVITGAR